MNEMLGNQYFITRRFKEAASQFERCLLFDQENDEVKKKLIVCYIQQNESSLALKLFAELITKNIGIVLSSNPAKDACPCLELINQIENFPSKLIKSEKDAMLGMLWLYCDALKSRKLFNKLLQNEPNNIEYQTISRIINQPFPTY